jgi:hypothetical protein
LKSEGEVTSLSGADKREVRDNKEKWWEYREKSKYFSNCTTCDKIYYSILFNYYLLDNSWLSYMYLYHLQDKTKNLKLKTILYDLRIGKFMKNTNEKRNKIRR